MQPYQLKNFWQELLVKSRDYLSEIACEKWIAPLKPISLEKNVLTLSTKDALHRQWVEERYLSRMEEAAFELSGEHLSIVLKIAGKKVKVKPDDGIQTTLSINGEQNFPEQKKSDEEIKPTVKQTFTPNPKYTFDTFVIGKSNEFAHAAAVAVCNAPGKTYNPFFIYGGVGLGKTHLMQAIGNRIFQTMPQKKILYASTEQFTNELIAAIREHKIGSFKSKYRKVDVLLIDDVQFLSGKDSTQEEFFHTFNELHNLDKQIVISGDRPPQEIIGIEERLRSRFAWGLCTDVQKPDLETRIAILQKKAMIEKILVPPRVLNAIAEKFDSNVRDLEGAFNRIVARVSLTNKSFESAFADLETDDKIALNSGVYVGEKVKLQSDISLKEIVTKVADHFATEPEMLMNNNRAQGVVRPRQIAMFLCRSLTGTSWSVIAKFFGKRDHATVMRAYNKIREELQVNPQLAALLRNLFPDSEM